MKKNQSSSNSGVLMASLNLNKTIISVLVLFCFFAADGFAQEKKLVPDFSFWTVGSSGAKVRFGNKWHKRLDELRQHKDDFNCLLQAIAVEPKTKEAILAHCSTSLLWLNQAIDTLIAYNGFGETDNGKLYCKIPIMTNSEMKRVQESLQPLAQKIAEKIRGRVQYIKQSYNKSKLDSDPVWDYVSHLVLDKFLLDGFFHHGLVTLEQEKGFKKYYSKEQKEIPAFFLERGSKYGTFGVNWYGMKGKDTERNVYILHGAPINRFGIPFNKYGWKKEFAEVFLRIRTDGRLDKLNEEEIQIFKNLGWIENHKLAIPFIHSSSLKVFKSDLENIGDEAAEVVFENFSIILNSFQHSSYSKFADGAGDYIQVCYHLLFSATIKELINIGVIPPVPEPLPETFGVYITIGSFWDD